MSTPTQLDALVSLLRTTLAKGTLAQSPGESPRETWGCAYAIWRFLHAFRATGTISAANESSRAFTPDLLVLLRQVVRWHGMPLALGSLHPAMIEALARLGDQVGIRYVAGHLEAEPFCPSWITESAEIPPLDDVPTYRRPNEPLLAEPYLTDRLGFQTWNSAAQKEAVWRALTAPPRSTTLVALPTGAGKSLCFQALSACASGLVVVIVPTIALAIDHYHSTRGVLVDASAVSPLYFTADDPALPAEQVLEEVRSGRCRLLFTSPEACVSGRLRGVLADAARSGHLEALVIDEAHLADSWGMFFRVDFQVLAALRRQWLSAPSARLRTLLLSATFSPECKTTLRRLFCEPSEQWDEVVSQRLRPEIVYFSQVFSSAVLQQEAVLNCAWRLPRPAIIYTTTRSDARRWTQRLREAGFQRVACFDGDTPAGERRSLLTRWREDAIDLMVATSAFGMGVDKPDVRTIVHACLPEDLHRFYQEVGRAGRDGATATSILLPVFPRDREVAEGLAPRLLRLETLGKRWKAMWGTHTPTDQQHVWRIRTDAAPGNLYAAETGRRNIAWNKRLLLQLARAQLIELLDVEVRDAARPVEAAALGRSVADTEDIDVMGLEDVDAQRPEVATIRLFFTPDGPEVEDRIRDVREAEVRLLRVGFEQMLAYALRKRCVGRLLQRLYGEDTVWVCAGCTVCRARQRSEARTPWLPISGSKQTSPSQIVIASVPSPSRGEAQKRQFEKLVRRLGDAGVRRFVCSAAEYRAVVASVARALNGVYRVDAWDGTLDVNCAPNEYLAVMHTGVIQDELLRLSTGARIYQLLTSGTPHTDSEGRRPLEQHGSPFYPTPDAWIS